MAINVGSVSVSVVPDATLFGEKLRAAIKDTTVTVKVDADTAEAQARIDELGRGASATIRADLDDAAAAAKLDELTRERTVRIRADADTTAANAKLRETEEAAGGAGGGMGALASAVITLGPALVPLAAGLGATTVALASMATAGAMGAGVLAIAFSGVSNAVGLLTQQHKAQLAASAASAAAAPAHAAAIEAASRQMSSAEMSLGDARRNAASAAVASSQQVAAAQYGLVQADQQEKTALQALQNAREAATRQLTSMANAAVDAKFAERQAVLDLDAATTAYNSTMASASSTADQRAQAQLNLEKAQQHVKESHEAATNAVVDNTKAQKLGVDGAPQVVSAAQAVATAQHNQAQAVQTLADAQAKAANQQIVSAEAVTRAEQGVAAAADAMEKAQRASAGTTSAALAAVNAQIAALDPATRAFAEYVRGPLMSAWKQIQAAASGGLLPGVKDSLAGIIDEWLPSLTNFISGLSKVLGNLARDAEEALESPFWRKFFDYMGKTAGPILDTLGRIIGNLIAGFAGMLMAFAPVSDSLIKGMGNLAERFANFWASAGTDSGFQKFIGYLKQELPKIGEFFSALFTMLGHVGQALAPLGGIVIDVLTKLMNYVNKIPISTLEQAAGAIMGVVVGMKAWGAAQSVISGLEKLFAMNPVLLALALVAGAFILVYENSKTFRDFISEKVLPTLKEWGGWLMEHLIPAFKDIWTFIKDKLVPVLAGVFMDAWNGIVDGVNLVKDAISEHKDQLKDFWDHILVPLIDWIVTKLIPVIGPWLSDVFKNTGIIIGGIIAVISDTFSVIHDLVSIFADIFTGNWHKLWEDVKKLASDAWTQMQDIVKIPIEFIINTVLNDGLIKAYNAISGVFGAKPIDPIPDPFLSLGFAPVATGHAAGARAMAEGGLVSGPGTGTSDSIDARLSNGEFVVNAAATAANLPLLAALNGGLGDGGPGFSLGGLVGDIAGWLSDPLGHLGDSVKGLFGSLSDTAFGRMLEGGVGKLVGKAADYLKSLFGSSGGPVASAPGGGVEQWRSVVDQVLGMLGQPLAMDNGVLSLIKSESGGNPNAINLTDSNARAGHPSQGLMQTIPTTFMAYAGPFAGRGITDPLANIYAGVSYALKNYGPAMLMAGGRHGAGGQYIGYDSGGTLDPGYHMVYNGTGAPEIIAPRQTFAQVMSDASSAGVAAGGGDTVIHLYDANDVLMGTMRGAIVAAGRQSQLTAAAGTRSPIR